MIVDTSVLVAIVRDEHDAEVYTDLLLRDASPRISAANFLEAAVVVDARRDAVASRQLDAVVEALRINLAPVTPRHAHLARQAHRDFGKGSGHPAKLNFGDCFSYALAKATGEPLLFKGNDFSLTDVRAARRV